MAKKQHRKSFTAKQKVLIILGVVFALLVALQTGFNLYVNRRLDEMNTFNMRTLIVDALRGIEALKKTPLDNSLIPEANLQLSAPSQITILYEHDTLDNSNLWVTSREILSGGIGQVAGIDHETLFESVPTAQACSRGFLITFDSSGSWSDQQILVSEKQLDDGRVMNIYRETLCSVNPAKSNVDYLTEKMDELQAVLLAAQSL